MKRENLVIILFVAAVLAVIMFMPHFRNLYAGLRIRLRGQSTRKISPTTASKGNDSGGVLTNTECA